ncbi:MAG: hypothetical protein ACI8PZ_004654 [Myxococcota bacterium]
MNHAIATVLLRRPTRIAANLTRLRAAGRIDAEPTLWQVFLGVLYMRYRVTFRADTVGVADPGQIRATLRARLLAHRPLRLPFLVAERVIAPRDLTGLIASPEFLERHLLGAFHLEDHAVYDLELLACHPGRLVQLRDRVAAVAEGDTRRARWLQDLVVYDGYHARLLALVDRALAGDFDVLEPGGIASDASLREFIRWCCAAPATPAATVQALREGTFSLDPRSHNSSSTAGSSSGSTSIGISSSTPAFRRTA